MKLSMLGKVFIVVMAVILTVSVTAISYGMSVSNKPFAPAPCSDPFTWAYSNDEGNINSRIPYGTIDPDDDGGGTNYDLWGNTSSNDPDGLHPNPSGGAVLGQPCARYDKDVARTTVQIDPADNTKMTISLENAYPYYFPTVFFAFKCINAVGEIQTISNITVTPVYPPEARSGDITVTVTGINVGDQIPVNSEAIGALHILINQSAQQLAQYKFEFSIGVECTPPWASCGSGWAYGGDKAICFSAISPKQGNNWGWTNGPFPKNTSFAASWPLIVGAGSGGTCNPAAGYITGHVDINYNGTTKKLTVTYVMDEGYTLGAVQLWVGNTMLPMKNGKYLSSPGEFKPYVVANLDYEITTTYTFNVTVNNGSSFYIAAHANVYSMNCGQ